MIKGWLISLLSGHCIMVGSRVMTPKGMGTIRNGVLGVDLDCYSAPEQRGIRHTSFKIEDVKVKG